MCLKGFVANEGPKAVIGETLSRLGGEQWIFFLQLLASFQVLAQLFPRNIGKPHIPRLAALPRADQHIAGDQVHVPYIYVNELIRPCAAIQ